MKYSNLMNHIRIALVLCPVLMCSETKAQQDALFTQYMYNTVIINPAYAGSRGHLNFNAIHRSQWVGLDGAPTTQTFSVNDYLGNKMGLGLSAVRDEIGPAMEINVTVDYAYTLTLGQKDTKLALGLKAGLHNLDINLDRLNIEDPTEVNALQNVNQLSPQIGAGVYLYGSKWYLGISTPNFLKTDHYDEVAVSTASERLHVFTMAGYVFDLNPRVKFKPSVLLRKVGGAPVSFDIASNFMFYEKFVIGASYRWDSSVSALAAFQLSPRLMLGYAYDFDTTELARFNSGSHEIFLRFELFNKINGKVSPRFF